MLPADGDSARSRSLRPLLAGGKRLLDATLATTRVLFQHVRNYDRLTPIEHPTPHTPPAPRSALRASSARAGTTSPSVAAPA